MIVRLDLVTTHIHVTGLHIKSVSLRDKFSLKNQTDAVEIFKSNNKTLSFYINNDNTRLKLMYVLFLFI